MNSGTFRLYLSFGVLALAFGSGLALAQNPAQPDATAKRVESGLSLEERFHNPPNDARPRVWWHWIGGNVARDGARLDLEWMQRIGIGGFHVFSGELSLKAPLVVPRRVPFMSDEWKETLRDAVRFAHSHGMEVGIAGSPGWSETGGPWVIPEDGMKKYVWSETRIHGGAHFTGVLAPLPSVTGPFQYIPAAANHSASPMPERHQDSYVIAFRTGPAELRTGTPVLSANSPGADLVHIRHEDLRSPITLPMDTPEGKAWIQAAFPSPTLLGAVTLGLPAGATVDILASDDGTKFRPIASAMVLTPKDLTEPLPIQTIAFTQTKARFFRVMLEAIAQPSLPPIGPEPQKPPLKPERSI